MVVRVDLVSAHMGADVVGTGTNGTNGMFHPTLENGMYHPTLENGMYHPTLENGMYHGKSPNPAEDYSVDFKELKLDEDEKKLAVEAFCQASDGTCFTKQFDEDTKSLLLSGLDLVSISFKSPAGFVLRRLKEVSLAANKLTEIDLSILQECENIEAIMLNGNRLENINLSMLGACEKLQRLWLHNNRLTNFSMNVISNFPALQSLSLENNFLDDELSLYPLAKCRVLRTLRVGGNSLNGTLDVTPLLSCKTLSIFDADASVKLIAYTSNASDLPSLPPALRKRTLEVEWREETTFAKQMQRDRHLKKMKVLAIGFQPRHIGAMAQLLCASGTLEMIVYRESMALSPELLKDYSIALVHPTKEEKLQELRIATKKLPVVVVGNSATYADAASRCLRKGARCFIPEPLTERTAMSIRSLAQQFARTQTNVVMGRSAPQRVQTQEKKKKLVIDFDEMRMKYEGKNGRIKETPRQRLEESALGMLAQRKRGPLQRDDFSPVATLCGLPACAGEVLYDAVVRFDTSDGVDEPNASEIGVSKELLMKFWNERLRHFDTETRLFNILCGPNSNLASEENMKVVMGKLLRSRGSGFSLIRANARDQSLKQLEEIATAIVFFGISGSMQPLRKSQLRKINFCKVLNTVESGVFNGFAASLRPDRFQGVLCALNDAGNKGYMELEDVQLFNAEHRLLVNAAVKRLFKTYCDKNQKMSVGEFTRFYLASMDPTSDAACKYLFPALDADLDGFVSAADLAIMYRSKKYDVEFGVLWSSLLDLIGSSNNSARTDQVSSSNILALAGKDRALLLKTLIYIDDDMEVDIHRSR